MELGREVGISGALVNVELLDASGGVIHVDVGRDQYESLHVDAGEMVYVKPKRLRVFTSE